MRTVTHTALFELCYLVFQKVGADHKTAASVATSFVDANLMGFDSHGVAMLYRYLELSDLGWLDPKATPVILSETEGTALIDGLWSFGQVACHFAMDVAKQKAKKTGIACVSVCNASHCGRLGQYPERISREGLIGLAMVNNHGAGNMVAPFGGTERRLSTNPLAVAIPYLLDRPILLDMTTSVVAERKIKLKQLNRESIPAGWFITRDGRTPIDPDEFYAEPKGALLPLGGDVGYKGYGLSIIVDVLAGALSGAGCSNPGAKRVGNAFFGVVISPDRFDSTFGQSVEDLIEYVKSASKAPGVEHIYYPGELEYKVYQDRKENGIPLTDETWEVVQKALSKVGIDYDPVAVISSK